MYMTDQTIPQTIQKGDEPLRNENGTKKEKPEQENIEKQNLLRLETGYGQHASHFR
jgi:hypothetical protein